MARTSHHHKRSPNSRPSQASSAVQHHSTITTPRPIDPRPQLRPPTQPNTDHLMVAINTTLGACLAKSTLDGYASAVSRFLDFCNKENISAARCFPTDEPTLATYAASFAGSASGKTAASVISALKTWHALHNQLWHGSMRVTYVLKGVSNLAPPSSHKLPRAGVDRDALRTLHDGLALSNPFDAATYAAATTAFRGQCHLGELLGTSRIKHRPEAFPSRTSISVHIMSSSSTNLHLPRTKTAQAMGEHIRITTQSGRTDLIYAIRNHLHMNHDLLPSSHLFAFRNATGNIRCLTKEPFLKRCNEIWTDKGLDRLTSHSFRIGGTNHFLSQGVAPDIVKVMGRWCLDAFLVYWRNVHAITSRHADHASCSPRS